MNIITLDFETFFSDDYTLKKLSTEEYVRDPRFEAHGCAIRLNEYPDAKCQQTLWYDQPLKDCLWQIDWENTGLISWHAQFDAFILSHHYNIKPKFIFCPMSMARMLIGNHISVSLDSVRSLFGLAPKSTPYNLFKGKHWHELTSFEQRQVAEGACDEVESIWKIFNWLATGSHPALKGRKFPKEEYELVDMTVRMFTEPTLVGDVNKLAEVWEKENALRQQRNDSLGVTSSVLGSSSEFISLLEAEGVEIEYKEGKNGPIPAFAKTDDFMRELLDHENGRVQRLAEARLGIKSTGLQTRAETLGFMSNRGRLCVYLRYCGAHTTRWSGGDGSNFQNFKRGSDIRKAICAPPGYLLAPIDLSQIECRILNYLAGQNDVIENFRLGRDPYVGIASEFYGRNITKADAAERGTGKQAELSCGYGCGAPKFRATAKLGIYGPPVELDIGEAERFVQTYRKSHPFVTRYWSEAGRILGHLYGGGCLDWGPMQIKDKCVYLPNGAMIIYETLEWHQGEDEHFWRFRTRKGWAKMYGAKLVENVVQALATGASSVMSQGAARIRRLGYRIASMSHDEVLVLIPKDGREQEHLATCVNEMKRTPDWLPGIPLDAEGSMSERYEK